MSVWVWKFLCFSYFSRKKFKFLFQVPITILVIKHHIRATSMYFWSVTLVYQLSGQFHIFLVDQKPISHIFGGPIFFWSTKNHFLMFLVDQFFFWSTKFIFGQPKKKLVDQKNVKLTGQLVDQRDWPKVHGRRFSVNFKGVELLI